MPTSLRNIAIDIWKAGVAAVDSERLIRQNVSIADGVLRVAEQTFDLAQLGRVVVVGAGKAGAGMASAVEAVFVEAGLAERLIGWVNVPADCVGHFRGSHSRARLRESMSRREGVAGSEQILELVSGLQEMICASLFPEGAHASADRRVSLEDKQSSRVC